MSIAVKLRQIKGPRVNVGRLALSILSLLSLLALHIPPVSAAAPACVITPVHKGHPPGPVISANGGYIAYTEGVDIPGSEFAPQVFVYNRLNKQVRQASLSYNEETLWNDDSYSTTPAISDNGRIVVFFSNAKNMVPEYSGDMFQLYIRDMVTNRTELVTKSTGGVVANQASWSPALNFDGRYVAFQTRSTNLDPNDTGDDMDTYVRDRKLKITERVSIASDGSEGNYTDEYGFSTVDISADGRYVVFNSEDLKGDDGVVRSGIFLRDRTAKRTYFIAKGFFPVMTPDARYIVFETGDKLLPADQSAGDDLYLYTRSSGTFELITAGADGTSPGTEFYFYNDPVISADGSQVAFATRNPNIVADDTNNASDVFVRDRNREVTERLTVNAKGQQGNSDSSNPSISADGRFVTFYSGATNLSPSVTSPGYIYLCDRPPGGFVQGGTIYMPYTRK